MDDEYTNESLNNLSNWKTFTDRHIQMGGYTSMAEVDGKIIARAFSD